MGLDQYLIKFDENGVDSEAIYWRKCNQIHGFFDNLVGGVENCEYYDIELENLYELKRICEEVIKRPNSAEIELPTQMGFFFGGYEYDEYYFEQIKYTLDKLHELFKNHNENDTYRYYAWW